LMDPNPNSNLDSDSTIRGDGKNVSICCTGNYHKKNHKSSHYGGKNFNFIRTSS
jgi:hypothetical protein